MAVTEEGTLMGAGISEYGHFANDVELTHKDMTNFLPWHSLVSFRGEKIIATSCGDYHAVATTESRKV